VKRGSRSSFYRWRGEGRGRLRRWGSSGGGGPQLKLSGALGVAVLRGEGAQQCECATAH
jgi:hypothetical protein